MSAYCCNQSWWSYMLNKRFRSVIWDLTSLKYLNNFMFNSALMVFNTSLKSRLWLLNTKLIIRGVEISGLFSLCSKHTLPPTFPLRIKKTSWIKLKVTSSLYPIISTSDQPIKASCVCTKHTSVHISETLSDWNSNITHHRSCTIRISASG